MVRPEEIQNNSDKRQTLDDSKTRGGVNNSECPLFNFWEPKLLVYITIAVVNLIFQTFTSAP